MAVHESYLREHASPVRRAARTASTVLLAITVLGLMGTDLPAAEALITQPFAATCFLAMLFGLAIVWHHPFQGGVITVVAWSLLAGASHGASMLPLAAFLVVALLDLACAWWERRRSQHR